VTKKGEPLAANATRLPRIPSSRKIAPWVSDRHVATIALERAAVVLTSDPEDIARWDVLTANIVRC
jgi:hypothetical protein